MHKDINGRRYSVPNDFCAPLEHRVLHCHRRADATSLGIVWFFIIGVVLTLICM